MKEKFVSQAGFEPTSPHILVGHDIHYTTREAMLEMW